MCVALDQIAQEARLEGEIRGKSQAKAEFIKSMQSLGYTEEEIQKIIQNISDNDLTKN